MRPARSALHALGELVWPRDCLLCGAAMPAGPSPVSLCPDCKTALGTDPFSTCTRCASSIGPHVPSAVGCARCEKEKYHFASAQRLGVYDGRLRDAVLKIKNPQQEALAETLGLFWGEQSRTYTTKELENGINLAKDFDNNPLVPAFKKIWDAVSKKQDYETRQIKTLVHGPEGAADLEATFALTEKARAPLANAILAAKQATEHEITVAALK